MHFTGQRGFPLSFFSPSLFHSPLPSSLAPYAHTDTETTTEQNILRIPQRSACSMSNRPTAGKNSLFSLSCSRLQSWDFFFSLLFFSASLQQRTLAELYIITHVLI